jgi:hypothetical protein
MGRGGRGEGGGGQRDKEREYRERKRDRDRAWKLFPFLCLLVFAKEGVRARERGLETDL